MGLSEYMRTVGAEARKASVQICRASTETKNEALLAIGDAILAHRSALMSANEQDLESGRKNWPQRADAGSPDVHRRPF